MPGGIGVPSPGFCREPGRGGWGGQRGLGGSDRARGGNPPKPAGWVGGARDSGPTWPREKGVGKDKGGELSTSGRSRERQKRKRGVKEGA